MKKILTSVFLLTTVFLSTIVFASNTVDKHQKKLDVLFIQIAEESTLAPIKERPGYYQLQLKDVKEFIGYFSDRPARISGMYPLEQFVARWDKGTQPNSFNKEPPNADLNAIVYHSFGKKVVNIPLQLSSPNYNPKTHTMSYIVQVLPGSKATPPFARMGQTALFIDGYCMSCVAGGF
jgi:hypothetical protein